MAVRDIHSRSLATSTALTLYYVPDFVSPLEVTRVLDAAGIAFLLVGSHALGGWTRKPRSCDEVEVLSPRPAAVVGALRRAFPSLRVRAGGEVTRLRFPGPPPGGICVWQCPGPFLRAAFEEAYPVKLEGQCVRIPSLELALAMTHRRMRDPTGDMSDRYQHAHDFLCLAQTNSEIDFHKLSAFGDLCGGHAEELTVEVRRVRAGQKLTL